MERVGKGHYGAWAGLVFFFCAAFSVYSQNLVANGNFEAGGGSFEGWNVSHTINQTNYAYSGPSIARGGYDDSYYALFMFEQSGSGDILSQGIATIPGELYDVDFWAEDGDGHNDETDFSFGNFTDNLQNAWPMGPGANFGWKNFDFSLTATEMETELEFLIYADAGSQFGVDDISVVAVPQLRAAVVNSMFQVTVADATGPVVIQATTNFVTWVNVYTNTAPCTFTDFCKRPCCFYRAAMVSNQSQ